MLIRLTELVGPCIVMVYMVQQINCIRNREGEIIEVTISLIHLTLDLWEVIIRKCACIK